MGEKPPEEELSSDENIGTSQEVETSDQMIEKIPNGGLDAWLQVLGSFFLFFNSWFVRTRDLHHMNFPLPSPLDFTGSANPTVRIGAS